MNKNEQSLKEMWEIIRHTEIYINEILEGEKGEEKIFKEMVVENLPNWRTKLINTSISSTNFTYNKLKEIDQRKR